MRRLDLVPVESLITGPTREPLDINEVKKKLFGNTDALITDTVLDSYIMAARQHFEAMTGRQVMTATWEIWLDCFPLGQIELSHPPLLSVNSVKYVDPDGTLQTWASSNYAVKAPAGPYAERGWIEPVFGVTWPATRWESGAVRVQFQAGYGNALGDVPELIKSVLYAIASDTHECNCGGENTPAPVTTAKPSLCTDIAVKVFQSMPLRPMCAARYVYG